MKTRKEDIVKTEKLWTKREGEKAKDFAKTFEEINGKILELYTRLDVAKKLQDGATTFKIAGEIESLYSQKFTMQQKRGEEIERCEREIWELSQPYVEEWIDSLRREASRIAKAKFFDIVKTGTDLVHEVKIFTVRTNIYACGDAIRKIETAILELKKTVQPLAKAEAFFQKTLNDLPDIGNLEAVTLTIGETEFNEFRDSFAPVAGRLTEMNYFKAEEMAKARDEAEALQALIFRRKGT